MKNNIVEKIHNEFDHSVDVLLSYASKIKSESNCINVPTINNEDLIKSLKDVGFKNVATVKKYDESNIKRTNVISKKEELISKSTAITEIVEKYNMAFPFNKLILYSQVIKICEKYNLVIGPASKYKGDIPEKNIIDIKNFNLEKVKNHAQYYQRITSDKPLCCTEPSASTNTGTVEFYICGPSNEFENKNIMQIGTELFPYQESKPKWQWMQKPVKDPIVLCPVNAFPLDEIAFLIVTAWGKEASDDMVANQKFN